MKLLIIGCALFAMLALSACVRVEVVAEDYPHLLRRPIDVNAVAVGISMKVKRLFGSLSYPEFGAYFIRLEEKEDILRQDRLIYSDIWSNGYVYLLNAQPGRYAVVAVKTSAEYTYLLPKALIQQTMTTVAPGTIGYLGDYDVETAWGRPTASDESIENYYFHLLSDSGLLSWGLPRNTTFVVQLLNGTHDEQGERQFLKLTDEGLLAQSGGAWSTWIQQRLQSQQ